MVLLRKKMLETTSDKFIIVVDDTKLVDDLCDNSLVMLVEVVQLSISL